MAKRWGITTLPPGIAMGGCRTLAMRLSVKSEWEKPSITRGSEEPLALAAHTLTVKAVPDDRPSMWKYGVFLSLKKKIKLKKIK